MVMASQARHFSQLSSPLSSWFFFYWSNQIQFCWFFCCCYCFYNVRIIFTILFVSVVIYFFFLWSRIFRNDYNRTIMRYLIFAQDDDSFIFLVPFTTNDLLHSVGVEKGLAFREWQEMFTKNRVEVITTTLFSALKLYTLPFFFLSDRV